MDAFVDVTTWRLETERLMLRPWREEDLEDFYRYASVPGVGEMAGWDHHENREKSAAILKLFMDEKKTLALEEKATGRVIGYILFHELDEGVYEMGWFFNRTCWGNGYALEACKAVVDHAFNQQNAHKIFAETIDGGRSVGLMKKLGMKPEGIQRSQVKDRSGTWADLYLYGLLAEDR